MPKDKRSHGLMQAFSRPSTNERLQAILRVASDMFNRRGIGGTSMDEIANALGIKKASLYNYFSGKDELVYLCQMRALEITSKVIDFAESTEGSGLDKIAAHNAEYHRIVWISEPNEFPLMINFDAEGDYAETDMAKHVKKLTKQRYNRLRRILLEGMNDGSIRKADPMITLRAMEAPYQMAAKWYRSGRLTAPAIVEILNEFILGGLRAR